MANISDNMTRTRWGRRKPWIFIGGPFYAIVFFVLMSPPDPENSMCLLSFFAKKNKKSSKHTKYKTYFCVKTSFLFAKRVSNA